MSALTFKTQLICAILSQTNCSVNLRTEAVCRSNETIRSSQMGYLWDWCFNMGWNSRGRNSTTRRQVFTGHWSPRESLQERQHTYTTNHRKPLIFLQGNSSAENTLLVHIELLNDCCASITTKIHKDLQFELSVDSNGIEQVCTIPTVTTWVSLVPSASPDYCFPWCNQTTDWKPCSVTCLLHKERKWMPEVRSKNEEEKDWKKR